MISQARSNEEPQEAPEPRPEPSMEWWLEPVAGWPHTLTIRSCATDMAVEIDPKTGATRKLSEE
jgi:hypothetical protein